MNLPDEFVAKLVLAKLEGLEHAVIELPNEQLVCSCQYSESLYTPKEKRVAEQLVIEAYSSQLTSKTARTESYPAWVLHRIHGKHGSSLRAKHGS